MFCSIYLHHLSVTSFLSAAPSAKKNPGSVHGFPFLSRPFQFSRRFRESVIVFLGGFLWLIKSHVKKKKKKKIKFLSCTSFIFAMSLFVIDVEVITFKLGVDKSTLRSPPQSNLISPKFHFSCLVSSDSFSLRLFVLFVNFPPSSQCQLAGIR